MKRQQFRLLDQKVVKAFIETRHQHTENESRLKFAWSHWGFGTESLEQSADRLAAHGIRYIELHGNLYSADMGYRPESTQRILSARNIAASPERECGTRPSRAGHQPGQTSRLDRRRDEY